MLAEAKVLFSALKARLVSTEAPSRSKEERFASFEHRWAEYKVIAGVRENTKQELALCLSDEVAQLVYGRYGHKAYTALT